MVISRKQLTLLRLRLIDIPAFRCQHATIPMSECVIKVLAVCPKFHPPEQPVNDIDFTVAVSFDKPLQCTQTGEH